MDIQDRVVDWLVRNTGRREGEVPEVMERLERVARDVERMDELVGDAEECIWNGTWLKGRWRMAELRQLAISMRSRSSRLIEDMIEFQRRKVDGLYAIKKREKKRLEEEGGIPRGVRDAIAYLENETEGAEIVKFSVGRGKVQEELIVYLPKVRLECKGLELEFGPFKVRMNKEMGVLVWEETASESGQEAHPYLSAGMAGYWRRICLGSGGDRIAWRAKREGDIIAILEVIKAVLGTYDLGSAPYRSMAEIAANRGQTDHHRCCICKEWIEDSELERCALCGRLVHIQGGCSTTKGEAITSRCVICSEKAGEDKIEEWEKDRICSRCAKDYLENNGIIRKCFRCGREVCRWHRVRCLYNERKVSVPGRMDIRVCKECLEEAVLCTRCGKVWMWPEDWEDGQQICGYCREAEKETEQGQYVAIPQ